MVTTKVDLNKAFNKTVSEYAKYPWQVKEKNSGQIADRKTTKVTTNSGQIADRKTTNSGQVKRYSGQIADRIDDIKDDIERTNSGQIADKMSVFDISLLSGNEKIIFKSVFKLASLNGNRKSQKITIELLQELTNIASKSGLKKSLERLFKKNVLIRKSGKRGRGGWMIFEIPESIFGKAFSLKDDKWRTNGGQMADKWTSEKTTEWTTTAPCSSSIYNNNNKTTTTTPPPRPTFELSEEWLEIDFSQLEGFSTHHIKQISKKERCSAQQLQDSIDAFVFDLRENNKTQTIKSKDPLTYFLAIIHRQGIYTPPSNYESDRDQAMRAYLERQKEQIFRRQEIEKEALASSFENWLSDLSVEEQAKLLEMDIKFYKPGKLSKASLEKLFRETEWIKIRESIFTKTKNKLLG